MAERLGEALLEIGTIDKGYAAGVDGAKRRAEELARHFDRVGKRMRNVGAALSLAVTAPLVLFARRSVEAFNVQDAAMAKVRQGLASTGAAAGRTAEQLFDAASALQEVTRFGDEAILDGVTAQLLTFTNIAGEQFDRTQQAVLDVATVLGSDLQPVAIQLGKALNDPVRNLSALARSGIQFTDAQKDVIKSLAESGRLAEAQTIILDELARQYGGQAAAAAETFGGKVQQLSNAWGDFYEKVGKVISEILPPLIDWLKGVIARLQSLSPETLKWGVILAGLAATIGPVLAALGLMTIAIGGLIPLVSGLGVAIAALAGPIGVAIAAVTGLVAIYLRYRDVSDDAIAQMPAWEKFFAYVARGFQRIARAIGQAASALAGYLSLSKKEKLAALREGISGVQENIDAQKARVLNGERAMEQLTGFQEKYLALRERERQLEAEIAAEGSIETPAVKLPAVSVPSIVPGAAGAGGSGGGGGGSKSKRTKEADGFARAMEAAADAVARVRLETRALDLTEAQVARLRLETDLMAAAEEQFGTVSEEVRGQIAAMGDQIEIETQIKQANREETERLAAAEEDRLRRAAAAAGEITGPLKDALKGGLDGATSFAETMLNIMTRLRDRLIDAAFRPIEDALANLFAGVGKSGGGGIFGKLLGGLGSILGGAVGGGGKAGGTMLKGFAGGGWAEGWAMVGELGPEPVYLGQGGRVMSNADMRAAMGQGGQQPVNVQVITRDPDTQVRIRPSAATTARDMRRAFGMGGAYG